MEFIEIKKHEVGGGRVGIGSLLLNAMSSCTDVTCWQAKPVVSESHLTCNFLFLLPLGSLSGTLNTLQKKSPPCWLPP